MKEAKVVVMKTDLERGLRALAGSRLVGVAVALLLTLSALAFAQRGKTASCQILSLRGEISAEHEWRQEVGDGWVLRLVPIVPGASGYTGWDVVMDRVAGAGFPDALLLATPPYGSINEREIGTTFGLRAQDAIGWNPRGFHFLTDEKTLHVAQKLYAEIAGADGAGRNPGARQAEGRLMELAAHASFGQLRIEDAKLALGTGDAPTYAENWALRAARTPHTEVSASSGRPAARGSLEWMRFTVTLWLPSQWIPPQGVATSRGACQQ